MSARIPTLIAAAAALIGCAPGEKTIQPGCTDAAARAQGTQWRSMATDKDRGRIRNWRAAWVEALAQARTGGHDAEIAAEGGLLDPDAALPFTDIPPGDYRCRTIKIGNQRHDLLSYVAYPAFHCRIYEDEGKLRFTKRDGSQRPIGALYPDGDERRVFLGTLQLGDEQRAFRYGEDGARDMAAVLQTVGERRWRLVFPYPSFESTTDIVELTPGEGQ